MKNTTLVKLKKLQEKGKQDKFDVRFLLEETWLAIQTHDPHDLDVMADAIRTYLDDPKKYDERHKR